MKWLALALLASATAARADADTWSGFYGGLGVGGAKANSTWTTDATLGTLDETVDHNGKGAMGGLQYGYRAALGQYVRLGVELAWYAARIEAKSDSTVAPNRERITRVHDPLSIALQLGLAGSHTLFYARGGWAYANIELQAINHNVGNVAVWDDHATGWTAGGGFEVKLRKHWSAGLEYDTSKLKMSTQSTVNSGGVQVTAADFETRIKAVLLRLNYLY